MIFSVFLKYFKTFYICINIYIKLSFMVHEHRFNLFSNNLVKIHNTPKIGGLATKKSLFSKEMKTKKVPNLFKLHHILVKDETMH